MNSFPRKVKTSPIPETSPNLAGLRTIRKKASWAEAQKFLPWIAIFRKMMKSGFQSKKSQSNLNVRVFIEESDAFFKAKRVALEAFHSAFKALVPFVSPSLFGLLLSVKYVFFYFYLIYINISQDDSDHLYDRQEQSSESKASQMVPECSVYASPKFN